MKNLENYYFGDYELTINWETKEVKATPIAASDFFYPDKQLKDELGAMYGFLYE